MQLYRHQTLDTDKMKARSLLRYERNLTRLYDNMLVSIKEGTAKSDLYDLLKDEKDILEEFEHKVKSFGWL